MHQDNAIGDNLSLPLEHISYYNGYTFEEVMEFVLESLAEGIVGYQGHPTDKFPDGEFYSVCCLHQ